MLDISLELKGKGGEVSSAENTLGACLRRLVPTSNPVFGSSPNITSI